MNCDQPKTSLKMFTNFTRHFHCTDVLLISRKQQRQQQQRQQQQWQQQQHQQQTENSFSDAFFEHCKISVFFILFLESSTIFFLNTNAWIMTGISIS